MTICNAITAALKQSCGREVKAYNMHDDATVVVQDMLTTLERTLVDDGPEQLVSEARHMLIGRLSEECRANIEQATGAACGQMADRRSTRAPTARLMLVKLQPL